MESSEERLKEGSWVGESVVRIKELGAVPIVKGEWAALPHHVAHLVADKAALLKPKAIWICDGSEKEAHTLRAALIADGTLVRVPKHSNIYVARTDPADVAHVEERCWTVSAKHADTESTTLNEKSAFARWMSDEDATREINARFPGAMRGRTMYVVPFCLGPVGGKYSMVGVELTDSAFVVLCLRLLAHVTTNDALWHHQKGHHHHVTCCVHSVGVPLPASHRYPSGWECNPARTIIIHRPLDRQIWSFGSAYGGNGILSKKCMALRVAGCIGHHTMAKDPSKGWMAVHMGIFSLTRLSDGCKRWFGVAFPPGCGKTNLAMLKPSKPGWKVECLSDDIAWLRWNRHTGRLCAMNPESGLYGVAPGINRDTNPIAMDTIDAGSILTNIGLTNDGNYYWEGLEDEFTDPNTLITDWTRKTRPLRDCKTGEVHVGFAHPSARFAVPLSQCPIAAPESGPRECGVPLDAIIFGSRRPTHYPLVYEATHLIHPSAKLRHSCSPWLRGTFIGASLRSEVPADTVTNSRSSGSSSSTFTRRKLQLQPFAMRSFLGYNFGQFIRDWIALGETPHLEEGVTAVVPRVFHVNWFREDERTGLLLWPGFGENIRVLEWMMRRLDEGPGQNGVPSESGTLSMLGIVPAPGALDLGGLGVNEELLFEQTWVELGDDVVDVVEWFKVQGGREFPLRLVLCGFQHVGVHVKPAKMEIWRAGWRHLTDMVEDITQRPTFCQSAILSSVPDSNATDLDSTSSRADSYTDTDYVNKSPASNSPASKAEDPGAQSPTQHEPR